MAWTRKKLRRKARKAAKAERPLSFSDEAKATTEQLLDDVEHAVAEQPETRAPGGLHDVDLDA